MATQGRANTKAEPTRTRSARTQRPQRQVSDLLPAVAIGLLVVVTIAFFWRHLTGGAFLWEDFTEFTYPNEVFAARSFASGILPYWNPFTFNGMPFLADLQIGYFYPGNLLMYLLSGGDLSVGLIQFFVVLHYLIAMIGTWKLSRYLGIGNWGATFAGISYGLSGILVAHMIHFNMLQHLAWFPLIVYLFYRALVERSWLHSLLAGLVLGIAMLSGHPQSTLYIIFFLFCLMVFQLVREARSQDESEKRPLLTGLIVAAVPIVIGAGIFAVQLLPSQELAGLSERSTMSYEKSLEGAMSFGQLVTLVVPKIYGVAGADTPQSMSYWYRPEIFYYWETAIYIGIVGLLLAVVGVVARRLGPLRWFLGGMAVLGVLYGLGDSFFIHPVLSKLPLFGTFRSPVRLAMYLSLGGAILGGVGLERVLRGDEAEDLLSKTILITGGVIVLIAILGFSGSFGTPPAELPGDVLAATRGTAVTAIVIGIIATLLAWAGLKGRVTAPLAGGGLLLLAVIDLFIFGYGQNASLKNPRELYDGADKQFAFFKAAPPKKIFRVNMRSEYGMLMPRNQGPYSGIMLYEGYNPLLLARRVPPAPSTDASFDLLDVRYGIRIDSAAGQVGLAERPTALPHARMLYDVRVMDSAAVYNQMKSGGVDFATTVLLEKDPGIRTDGAGHGTATITSYDASEITTDVVTDKPGILLLSEIWYPRWSVTIDGNPAEMLAADYSLRGVPVPAGHHTVAMRFESSAFRNGTWITLASLAVSLVGIVVLGVRGRASRPAEA
jgi:hypothetical protein